MITALLALCLAPVLIVIVAAIFPVIAPLIFIGLLMGIFGGPR